MRLYNTEGAIQVDDPEFGTFKPDANGAFDKLPAGLYAKLRGRPGWENDAERELRVVAEQMEKLRDPATMLAEMRKMTANQSEFTALLANALGMAKAADAEAPTPPAPAASTAPATTAPDETPTSTPAPVKPARTSKKAAAAPPAA